MKVVGLTGGIGTGKTTVSKIFQLLDVPVYYADDQAKVILNQNEEVKKSVIELFGSSSYENGQANRKFIADKCFSNPDLLQQLNAIIHPAVAVDFEEWKKANSTANYMLKEAAILFESGSHKNCDKVILVTAEMKDRITRVMKRDGISQEQVEARIANQWPEEKKKEVADFVIENSGGYSLIKQVMDIHKLFSNEGA